jgi:hypothetical protein
MYATSAECNLLQTVVVVVVVVVVVLSRIRPSGLLRFRINFETMKLSESLIGLLEEEMSHRKYR